MQTKGTPEFFFLMKILQKLYVLGYEGGSDPSVKRFDIGHRIPPGMGEETKLECSCTVTLNPSAALPTAAESAALPCLCLPLLKTVWDQQLG